MCYSVAFFGHLHYLCVTQQRDIQDFFHIGEIILLGSRINSYLLPGFMSHTLPAGVLVTEDYADSFQLLTPA
jgi:hypothetical protein